MLNNIHPDSTIYVHEISRLARNLTDLLNLINEIYRKEAKLIYVKDNIAYDKINKKLMLSVATFEQDINCHSQLERHR